MKIAYYDVELIDELTGEYMDFEFAYELDEDSDELPEEYDMDLIDAILTNISVVPRLNRVEED